jgi:uncharacterized protein YndB with AHSA1/START domain
MRKILPLLLAAFGLNAAAEVSFVNEGAVNAPVEEVWKLFSTSEGYKVLGPAQAEVDLRVGGVIRTRYRTDGPLGDPETIETLILAYEPPTMMATRIRRTPQSFPFKEAWKQAWTVITLKPLPDGRTLVRVASLGFGGDAESLAMRKFFEAGNQQVIGKIQQRFAPAGN